MELMPHVKALLDDLVSLTKDMVVKRSDLAIANEGDTSNTDLYYAYKKVLDGEMTYNAIIKSDIPYSVLANVYRWTEDNLSNSKAYKLYPTVNAEVYQYRDNNRTITIRNKCDSNEEGPEIEYLSKLGDIYIRQNKPYIMNNGISGAFTPLYKSGHVSRYSNIGLYELYNGDTTGLTEDEKYRGIYRDSNGKIVNKPASTYISTDADNNYIFYNDKNGEIKLYIKNNEIGNIQEIRYRMDSEYVLLEDVQLEMMEFNTSDNGAKYTLDDVDMFLQGLQASYDGLDPDIYYGGFADLDYQEYPDYNYDHKKIVEPNGSVKYTIVKYVYDNTVGGYRVMKDDGTDSNSEVYYRRSYDEYYIVNDTASNNEVYVKKDTYVPYYYEKIDDVDYYEIMFPEIDESGNFVDQNGLPVEYDENGNKVDESQMLQLTGSGLYTTKEELADLWDETMPAYTKYYNNKAGMIDLSDTFVNGDGDTVNKYGSEIVKSDDSFITTQTAILYVGIDEYPQEYYEYYLKDNNGLCKLIDYNGKKVFVELSSNDYDHIEEIERYSRNIVTDPLFFVKIDDIYKYSETYIEGNTYFYYNDDCTIYMCTQLFDDTDIRNIWNNNYIMDDDVAQIIADRYCEYIKDEYARLRNDPRWSITRYDGEANAYYRSLNGLPPIDELENQPKIDRYKINPEYDGDEPNPYVYNLSDDEVDIIVDNGTLDKLKSIYTDADYLNHLGRYRIDVLEARDAGPFDILIYGTYQNSEYLKMFSDAYVTSKNYIMHNYYKPEMFDVNEYYGSYIAMTILVHALEICMARSGDILVHNKYSDYETVQMKLKSFGFENTFEHIPLIYRKNIAKNIELLIKNKGIDSIYDIVYKIFGIDDVEVYKYYIRKIHKRDANGNYLYDEDGKPQYELSMVQVPISSENVVRDIINPSNTIDYDLITEADKYWGVYEPKSNIKEMFKEYPFNYMNSKYITLNNKFDLSELNFSSSYYLNYVFELLGDTKYMIDIDGFDSSLNVKDLIVTLFAIQSIKYNYAGNIPNDLIAAASVLKFNLNEEVTITGEESITKSKLIEIIDKYYNGLTNRMTITNMTEEEKKEFLKQDRLSTISETEKYWRGKGKANNIKKNIISGAKPPIVLPSDVKDSNALDTISEAYLMNLKEDDRLTATNDEGSLYNTILRYRDDAKTYNDYLCFDTLSKLIAISKVTNDFYNIDSTWEQIAHVDARPIGENLIMRYSFEPDYYKDSKTGNNINDMTDDEIEELINNCWYYYDIGNVWTVIDPASDNEFIQRFKTVLVDGKIDEDIINTQNDFYICDHIPELYKLVDYDYAIMFDDVQHGDIINHTFLTDDKLNMTLPNGKIVIYKKTTIFPQNVTVSDAGIKTMSKYVYDIVSGNNNWNTKNITVADGSPVRYGKVPPESYTGTVTDGMYYVHVIDNEDGDTCTVNVYRYTKTAFTYEMYLKYKSNELYKYLQCREAEDYSDYIQRLNELYSIIIASIEGSLSNNDIRNSLKLSLIDFANIAKYIKIVIDIFKSYSIDLASMDAVYTIDDKGSNRIKVVDKTSINEHSFMNSNMHSHSMIAFNENMTTADSIGYHDEIIIEEIKIKEENKNA